MVTSSKFIYNFIWSDMLIPGLHCFFECTESTKLMSSHTFLLAEGATLMAPRTKAMFDRKHHRHYKTYWNLSIPALVAGEHADRLPKGTQINQKKNILWQKQPIKSKKHPWPLLFWCFYSLLETPTLADKMKTTVETQSSPWSFSLWLLSSNLRARSGSDRGYWRRNMVHTRTPKGMLFGCFF